MIATTDTLLFGPFRLLELVGQGGMGEVWRAVHEAQGVEVAIKVMSARRAADPRFQLAFREEVRAMARLEHPGIAMVFDCGVVGHEIEQRSGGRIIAGSSYLAMELAHGTLQDIDRSKLQWWHVRMVLLRILDTLAHSHARGVIHRDLKPANVLFVDTDDGPQLKLSDFGLAHAVEDLSRRDAFEKRISGTPRFMAPEQIMGRWRDQGPWTDLYAVGCLGYWLSSGEPPFSNGDTEQILRGHLYEALPPLAPCVPVPDGFTSWIERMLAKQPADRFRRAADAAHALIRLGEPNEPPPVRIPLPLEIRKPAAAALHADRAVADMAAETVMMSEIMMMPETVVMPDALLSDESAWQLQLPAEGGGLEHPAPIPASWRPVHPLTETHRRRSMKLVGVGLGLFGLRQIPLVGRVAERDVIWQALREVAADHQPRAIVLRGPAGSGKSRLAEWIAERAHEVGAASIQRAVHSPIAGPGDGVPRMVSNYLRCTGLPREQILERARAIIELDGPLSIDDLHECMALTELMAPSADPEHDDRKVRIRFTNPTERHVVLRRLLTRLTRRRPMILCLDDVQWGGDTLAFVEHLLRPHPQDRAAALVLMTVREEALAEQPLAASLLERIEALENVQTVPVEALAPDEHVELVQYLLGLEEALAHEVAERTAGNPLFAVQLVGDWVERDLLEVGDSGFRLRGGASAAVPENVEHLLRGRIEQLIGQSLDRPANEALLALELAAALGQEVEQREWVQVCRRLGAQREDVARIQASLLEAMVQNRLARRDKHGWTFVHGALRESLEHIARQGGRWAQHHLACAEMLRELYGDDVPQIYNRLARHLLEAGALEEALEPLLMGAQHYRLTCDFGPAHALFDLYESTLVQLGAPEADPRWLEGWLVRVRTLNRQGHFERSLQLLDACEERARQYEWVELVAETLYLRGYVAKMRGEIRDGIVHAEHALELYEHIDSASPGRGSAGIARAILLLGELSYWCGDLRSAKEFHEHAWERLNVLGAEHDLATCLMGMGSLYSRLEDYPRAIAYIEDAHRCFERLGDRSAMANCLNNMGDVYRFQGDLEHAEASYREANAMLERIGLGDDVVVRFNLGLTLIACGKYDEALPVMRRVLEDLLPTRRSGYLGVAYCGLLPCHAAEGDWAAWDHHIELAERCLYDSAFVDPDLASVLQHAGELALRSDEPSRARRALALALEQWRVLGDQPRTGQVEALLATST